MSKPHRKLKAPLRKYYVEAYIRYTGSEYVGEYITASNPQQAIGLYKQHLKKGKLQVRDNTHNHQIDPLVEITVDEIT